MTVATKARPTAKQSQHIKRRWENLRGEQFLLDYKRASLLHEVYRLYDRDSLGLNGFVTSVLGEFGGKRSWMFVHIAEAFDVVSDVETWRKLGRGVCLLSRLGARDRTKVMKAVDERLETSGRPSMSTGRLRHIIQVVVGIEKYSDILFEKRHNPPARRQLVILRRYVLGLLNEYEMGKLPTEVEEVLGIDKVTDALDESD